MKSTRSHLPPLATAVPVLFFTIKSVYPGADENLDKLVAGKLR